MTIYAFALVPPRDESLNVGNYKMPIPLRQYLVSEPTMIVWCDYCGKLILVDDFVYLTKDDEPFCSKACVADHYEHRK